MEWTIYKKLCLKYFRLSLSFKEDVVIILVFNFCLTWNKGGTNWNSKLKT